MAQRCDEVLVQVIVRSYDEKGRAIAEAITQPVKVFRANAPDFWQHIDRILQQAPAVPPAPVAAPPPVVSPAPADAVRSKRR